MSRTVNGEWLFDDVAKEILRRQIWQVSDYCGVQVITYTVMSNHFHIVLRVPQAAEVSDRELMRRYRTLYPQPTRYQVARLEVITAQLSKNGPAAVAWRRRQLRLMGDVSQYMKLVKQRFSTWFNRTHDRFGTLWCERFKSVLVGPGALDAVAAYVDLNCVRAGLVKDPKDYRFCGYSEAVAGNLITRKGLASLSGSTDWASVHASYRQLLFGVGTAPREGAASIDLADAKRTLAAMGKLPLATMLRCRVRYFTDGAILGTRAFVAQWGTNNRTQRCSHRPPHPIAMCAGWADLAVLRRVRHPALAIG